MKNTIMKLGLIILIPIINLLANDIQKVENLVNKAYAYCEEKGLDKCVEEINKKNPNFVDGSLYIFISELSGVSIAHGGNAKLVGKDLSKIKSPSGTYPARDMTKIVKEKGSGWLEYKWSHPITRRNTYKMTFVKRYKNTNILIGSGYYK
jgi:cytochrome c